MRFHRQLELEKMRSKEEEMAEEKERLLRPVKDICLKQFDAARAWNDPIGTSLGRIPQSTKSEINTDTSPASLPVRPSVETANIRNGAVFTLYGSSLTNVSSQSLNKLE
ncbi:hypothetical protein HDU91_005146 [Kappamyces sp. JEL0680]|nr:hypothetical protein HDU91_005146 [Kappamyces sp. JEL0680]